MRRVQLSTCFILLMLLVGSNATAAIFKDFQGQFHTVEEYTKNGKWLIVMLWASDCHICNKEAHSYVDFHKKHVSIDASVLGLSLDGQEGIKDAQAFVQRHKINFPNLLGDAMAVTGYYTELTGKPWLGTPTFLVFSPSGELMAEQVGAVPTDLIEDFMNKNKKK